MKIQTWSIEFAHAEVADLKEEMKQRKRTEEKNVTRIDELEESNKRLQEGVVDLKARSMRNNLLFHNIEESDEENCAELIYSLLGEKLDLPDARQSIKIDRAENAMLLEAESYRRQI